MLALGGIDDASLRRLIDQAEHGSHDRRALFMRLRPEASVEGHVEQAIALLAETARRLWPVWFTDVSFAACGAGTLGKLAAGAIAREAALELALDASGLDKGRMLHRPRLLSDNGSSYISDDLAKWMTRHAMAHVRGASYHPMTQGKIERWHQTLKNRILLENYYLPGDLEAQIEAFVDDYNNRRYHESIDNLTPADVYFGRGQTILLQRERIKRQTIAQRRLQYQWQAA